MTPEFLSAMESLSQTQRSAVSHSDGAALVLAGPGVGKTTVLTLRVARILEDTPKERFRLLALTFTTKAGDEMRTRIETYAPSLVDRAFIGTFHSFCAHILRLHGSHLGIKPDFGIYDQDEDRIEVLREALSGETEVEQKPPIDDIKLLKVIDELRSKLVEPQEVRKYFRDQVISKHAARAYTVYEEALRRRNVVDFNGMILYACRLVQHMPAVAARIRQSYRYWLIDEFQDTSPAQYKLIQLIAGDTFRNVFAVADDDQIIYQWAGASYRQIALYREQFSPKLYQLVENLRCPPEIVSIANNLIANNVERTPGKSPLVAMLKSQSAAIRLRVFDMDSEEADGVALEIARQPVDIRGRIAVLGRTRAILEPVLQSLRKAGVSATISTRRDQFVSPQFVWLQACLDQSIRPTERRTFVAMVNAANRFTDTEFDPSLLIAEAEAGGRSYLEHWATIAKETDNVAAVHVGELAFQLLQSRRAWRDVLKEALSWLPSTAEEIEGVVSDVSEDKAAWEVAAKAAKAESGGNLDLPELLQAIALRPKDPPPNPHAVRLFTIHTAKGLEFDHVWLVGMAESILPSWQSLKSDAKSAELEEERRNCFVAITRTRHSLTLTRAKRYRGWAKQPSRFLIEMGIAPDLS